MVFKQTIEKGSADSAGEPMAVAFHATFGRYSVSPAASLRNSILPSSKQSSPGTTCGAAISETLQIVKIGSFGGVEQLGRLSSSQRISELQAGDQSG
jgi:hypothetical protein